jgi:hypothetical protein
MRFLVYAAALTACAPVERGVWEDADDPDFSAALPDLSPPPPYELELIASNIVAGDLATFTINGATPGATVRLMRGVGGILPGVCPGATGGRCVDIAGSYKRVATGIADGRGNLEILIGPPSHLGDRYVGFQAFVLSPTLQVSNPVGRLFGAAGTLLDPGIDGDGDGWTINDGDCADFTTSIHPMAAEVLGDGWDHDCDDRDSADNDRDGYVAESTAGDDCDDQDPAISPGATEVCDGLDNDCDDVVDNGGCYVWSFFRVGDCTGTDIVFSFGPDPDPARCNAGTLGLTAVNWDGISYFNGGGSHPWWTYKTTPAASCSGGGAPGLLYECVYVP